jgi:hypothetical protein
MSDPIPLLQRVPERSAAPSNAICRGSPQALVVIPDPSAPSRKHGLNAQQVFHLPRLENPALRVDQRDALAAELEPACEIGGIQHPASEGSKPVHVAECWRAPPRVIRCPTRPLRWIISERNISETTWRAYCRNLCAGPTRRAPWRSNRPPGRRIRGRGLFRAAYPQLAVCLPRPALGTRR